MEDALCSPAIIVLIHGEDSAGKNAPARSLSCLTNQAPVELDLHAATAVSVSILNSEKQQKEDADVVVDEFDHVATEEERARFAEFVQQLTERRVPIRFMLCQVSETLKELLAAHESSYCFVEDSALCGSGRKSCSVDRQPDVSAQAPHYVHLISEDLFWEMVNEPTFARSLR